VRVGQCHACRGEQTFSDLPVLLGMQIMSGLDTVGDLQPRHSCACSAKRVSEPKVRLLQYTVGADLKMGLCSTNKLL
jgi:hypothetical protein